MTPATDTPKLVPHDVEAEQAILSAIMQDPKALDQALEVLSAADFYYTKHRRIFQAMESLGDRRESIDTITLADELRTRSQIDEIGGATYLSELLIATASALNVRSHAKIVRETARLREWITIAHTLLEQAYERREPYAAIMERAEQSVFRLLQGSSPGGFEAIGQSLHATLDHVEALYQRESHLTGISTGFKDLDQMTAGWQPSDLVIIAARPSMGKTSLALSAALSAAREGQTVGFFSLEMSKQQLLLRLLSMGASIDSHVLRTGRLGQSEWWRVAEAVQGLEGAPLYIDDSGSLTMSQVRSRARRLKAEHGLGLLVIDYLQLLHAAAEKESRQQEISDISRALKALAKELNVPILALSQLSRAVESRKPPIPMLSDLRESGAIEQDADLVLFIYREEVYDAMTDHKGEAEILIRKQRNGPVGDCRLTFLDKFARFADLYAGPTLEEQNQMALPSRDEAQA